MATRLFFYRVDEPSIIYSTTKTPETRPASEHGYQTWYNVFVPKKKAEEVLAVIDHLYSHKTQTGDFEFAVTEDGFDFASPVSYSQLEDLEQIEGVEIEEGCTVYALQDPEGRKDIVFSYSAGDNADDEDGDYRFVRDEDEIKKLNECLDSLEPLEEQDNPHYTYYESPKFPEWDIHTAHDSDEQWFDFCIEK